MFGLVLFVFIVFAFVILLQDLIYSRRFSQLEDELTRLSQRYEGIRHLFIDFIQGVDDDDED